MVMTREHRIVLLVQRVLLLALLILAGCAETAYRRMSDPERDLWQHSAAVIQSLKLEEGARVADLGAGGGYFTFPLAQAVGRRGLVFAVDIDETSLTFIKEQSAQRPDRPANIALVLASPDNPHLPQKSVDLIFTCNTYHHLPERAAYFRALLPVLRPSGRVAVIDYNGEGLIEGLVGHWTAKETVRLEMEAAGYRLVEEFDYLPKQHFQIFSPTQP